MGFRSPTLQTGGFPMAEISPLRRRMIEDMAVRNLSPATQQSYLNAVSKFSRDLMACTEPDRLRAAVLLWRNARPGHGAGAHHLCAAAEQAAGRVEHRRGRALPGGNPEPQKPRRADHSLCRRTARVGSRSLKDRRH